MNTSNRQRAVACAIVLWFSIVLGSCGESAKDTAMTRAREFAQLLGTSRSHVLSVLGEPRDVAMVWGLPLPTEQLTPEQEDEFGERQTFDLLKYPQVKVGVDKEDRVTCVLAKCLLPHLVGMHQLNAISLIGCPDLVDEPDYVSWWPGAFTGQETTQRLQRPVAKTLVYSGWRIYVDAQGIVTAVECNW